MKVDWKPGTLIYPLPALMVSVGAEPSEYNILTVSWTGTLCSDPAMCYISVRKSRHSYDILQRTKAFVLNLTTENLSYATDWCGVKSGAEFNKFEAMHLTAEKAHKVNAPIIAESPLNIECEVVEVKELGSHDMFVAKVVNVQADERFIDPKTGAFDMEKARLLVYAHGGYYQMGKKIGKFGWSVQKKK
ncbi:MAG: flavin reductase family protein [Paludibacteraceae bacterium]|nr:flavin reductase family protein [Paludibacteraceae bacterium]